MTSSQTRTLSGMMWAAVAGQAVLLAGVWLLPAASEFDLTSDTVSELVLGRFGYLQAAAMVIAGVGVMLFAYALRAFTRGIRGSAVGSTLIGVYGAAAVIAGLVPTDEVDVDFNPSTDLGSLSATGTVHVVVALIGFVSGVAGIIVLAWTFPHEPGLRRLSPWHVLLATAAFSLLLAQQPGSLAGLMQRLLVTVIATWITLVALRVVTSARVHESHIYMGQ